MNENFATTTIDEHIAVETERREAFRNFLLEERIDPREVARRIDNADGFLVPCPACRGRGVLEKELVGKHEREKIRVRCETCAGAGEVLSAAGEAIVQLIRRALSGPVAPKVSDEVLAEELRAAEKRLDLRDKEKADKIAREEEARRIVAEAEALAKRIREGA